MPPSDINEAEEEEIVTQEGGNFTPPKVKDDVKNVFTGICIKRISQETDHCEVVELLKIEGLPEEYVKEIDFKENGSVVVKNLPHNICQQLIKTIHRRTMFGKRVFCNGLVTLTPEKKDNEEPHSSSAQSTPPPPVQITMETSNISKPTEKSPTTPVTFTQLGSNSDIDLFVEENQERLDREELARRHSLSMRSPYKGSLGAELLMPPPRRQSLDRTKDLLNEVKELSIRLSDYESCISTDDDMNTSNNQGDGFVTFNNRKRSWKNKRKSSTSPPKEFFLKKQNTHQ